MSSRQPIHITTVKIPGEEDKQERVDHVKQNANPDDEAVCVVQDLQGDENGTGHGR